MQNILSIDVEDWFHIPGFRGEVPIDVWPSLESHVEANVRRLLDLCESFGVTATCFTLGWVGERFPSLVREISDRGHEIASHGYGHQIISSQTREQFAADVRRAKDILEQASGRKVRGYRAPCFSISSKTRWALDEIVAAGYEYDSSIFPVARDHGGIIGAEKAPHVIHTENGSIIEFPISVAPFLGREFCFFGGGYLRIFPSFLIERMSERVNAAGRPVIYYIHPREIDPKHPRVDMPALKSFKCYVNLNTVGPKLRALFGNQEVVTFERWVAENRDSIRDGNTVAAA